MDDQDDMNDKPFDKNITNFGGLSAKRLKALLAILEPVTFSCQHEVHDEEGHQGGEQA